MTQSFRLSMFAFLSVLLVFTGCASKKKTTKQINALEAQVSALTEEVTRLDAALQQARGGSAQAQEGGSWEAGTSSATGSSKTYRTPSGFELPAINIQRALKNAGYYQGTLDGKIGSATKEAVKSFQKDSGLDADGVVGRRTWDKLKPFLSGGGAIK